jgi:hypothetical protein
MVVSMNNFLKTLVLGLVLINSVLAETVICPETITCNNESETCNFPQDFFIADEDHLGHDPGYFNNDLTLKFLNAHARKTTFIEKKLMQKNYLFTCNYYAKGENGGNVQESISIFANSLNFSDRYHRFPSRTWICRSDNIYSTPNVEECTATK